MFFERHLERIFPQWALPAIHVRLFRSQDHVGTLRQSRGFGNGHGLCRASGYAFAGEPVGRGKAPRAIRDNADPYADGFGLGQRSDLAVLCREIALPRVHNTHVCVRRSAKANCV